MPYSSQCRNIDIMLRDTEIHCERCDAQLFPVLFFNLSTYPHPLILDAIQSNAWSLYFCLFVGVHAHIVSLHVIPTTYGLCVQHQLISKTLWAHALTGPGSKEICHISFPAAMCYMCMSVQCVTFPSWEAERYHFNSLISKRAKYYSDGAF